MSPAPSSPEPRSAFSRMTVILAVVAVWTLAAAAVIVMTAVGQSLKTGSLDLLTRFIWDIGWLGWAPLTFLVFAICRRFPIERQHRLRSVLRLTGYGVAVVLLQMVIDFLCITAFGAWLRGDHFTPRHFFLIAVYKAHIYLGVYWMIVGAAHAWEYHRRFRQSELLSSQLETRLANAQLDRLKAQLQPHFLFNAHNTIVALVLKHEHEAAIGMLTRLSDLLRTSLSRSGEQLVTLREELDTLRLYLDIQRERFRDRLAIRVSAPDELADVEFPHLLLQPLVENAFRHGLEDVTEDGRLDLEVAAEDDQLVCTVHDNGAGFAAGPGASGEATGSGIGLRNTRERLRQLYGGRQSLAITSRPGAGCTVTLRLPLRRRTAREEVVR